jgi:hypothetical protein
MLPESRPLDQVACGFPELSARICDILITGKFFMNAPKLQGNFTPLVQRSIDFITSTRFQGHVTKLSSEFNLTPRRLENGYNDASRRTRTMSPDA